MSKPKKRGSNWPTWVAVAIGIPVLYVLSIGPWVWLFRHEMLPESAFPVLVRLYEPLDWAAKKFPSFERFCSCYHQLWGTPYVAPEDSE